MQPNDKKTFMFVCFGSITEFVPRGQLLREDLRRAPIPPRPLVTPGPRISACPLSPHTYVMHPASGQYPPPSSCPVQISYQVSGLSPPCLPVLHIYLTPTNMNPSNPTYKLCYFINSNNLIQIVTLNITSPLIHPPCLPVSASLTYLSGSLPLNRLILRLVWTNSNSVIQLSKTCKHTTQPYVSFPFFHPSLFFIIMHISFPRKCWFWNFLHFHLFRHN